MKKQLQQRLQSLKDEFEAGKKMLADLESQQVKLTETILRISGAIQVLEEELEKADNQTNGSVSNRVDNLENIDPVIEVNN